MTMRAALGIPGTVALLAVLAACGSADAGADRAAGAASPSGSYAWAQDCGVEYYKHLPHNPGASNDHAYGAEEYVGLSLQEATKRAESAGLTLRVLGTDGDCMDRTDDRRSNRVNFYVESETVRTAARF